MRIDDIKSVTVHWSESLLINDGLEKGENATDHNDIEATITPIEADRMIKQAALLVDGGYDKTSMTVRLVDESVEGWDKVKFYITETTTGLIDLING